MDSRRNQLVITTLCCQIVHGLVMWVCGVDHVAKQDKCVIYSFGMLCFSFFLVLLPLHRIAAALRFLPQYSTYAHVIMDV